MTSNENPTSSVDAYLREEHSCQNFIPIRFETTEPEEIPHETLTNAR